MKDRKILSILIILVLMTPFFSFPIYAEGLSHEDAVQIINSYWKDKGIQYEEIGGRVGTTIYEQLVRHINSEYAIKDELPSQFGNTGYRITEKGKNLFKSLCINPDNGGYWGEIFTHKSNLVKIDKISIDEAAETATVTATFEAELTDEFNKFLSPLPDYMKNEYNDYTYQTDFSLRNYEEGWRIEMP